MLMIVVIIFVTVASRMSSGSPFGQNPSGSCVGGPVMGEAGQSLGNGNFRFQCADGGSAVVHLGNP